MVNSSLSLRKNMEILEKNQKNSVDRSLNDNKNSITPGSGIDQVIKNYEFNNFFKNRMYSQKGLNVTPN